MIHLADVSISLLYSSKHQALAALPVGLSWAIVVGGCYGVLRLLIDVVRVLGRSRVPGRRAREE